MNGDYEIDAPMFWVLDADHNPVPATVKEFGKFHRAGGGRVELTQLPNCWVSTVFLGVDHGYGEGPPVLFETMVFKGDYHADRCKYEMEEGFNRYCTWDEAVAGHKIIVARLTQLSDLPDEH